MAEVIKDLSAYHVPGSNDAFYIPEFIVPEEESYLIRKISDSSQQKWRKLPNRRLQIWGGELTAKNILLPQAFPPYFTEFPDIVGRIRGTGAFSTSPHGAPNHVILNEYLPGQGIMPHEDGPSYHPVVATLTLGSHALFHYYRYQPEEDNIARGENTADSTSIKEAKGRPIDPTPVMSIFLEPRSLVITTSELYTGYLHGIEDTLEDVFHTTPGAASEMPHPAIANLSLLRGDEIKQAVSRGGTLKRGVRYSLTCRDVERVINLSNRATVLTRR